MTPNIQKYPSNFKNFQTFSLNFQSNSSPIPQPALARNYKAIYLMECAEIVVPIDALTFKGHFTCNCNKISTVSHLYPMEIWLYKLITP